MIIFKVRSCPRPLRAPTPPSLRALHGFTPRSRFCSEDANTSQDIIADDEIISDSYDMIEVDGVAYEVDCRMVTVGGETFGAHTTPPCLRLCS
jgi:hypothetical protein